MDSLQLSLPQVDSSPASLLQIIQQRDFPVEDLLLREITQRFHASVTADAELDLNAVGDLLAASARLVAWKSHCLLPDLHADTTGEDQAEPHCHAARIYPAEIRAGMEGLAARQGMESRSALPRQIPIEPKTESWPVTSLMRALKDLQKRQGPRVFRVVTPTFIRLEVALSHLIGRLRPGRRVSLGALLAGATRRDAVVHFLAVLELVRRRQAVAAQEQLFGEILVEGLEQQERAKVRARAG